MKVLAIIPAFNEEECLEATVSELAATCPGVDFLVVNDGSSDGTEDICQRNGYPHLRLPVNCGLASGFQAGMKYAERHGYDAAVQFDADGQHVPGYLPEMAAAMQEQDANIVIGSRVLAGEAPQGLRNVGSKLISWLIRVTTGATVTDPTSGLRMYDRSMMQRFAQGFDLSPEPDAVALLARRGARVVEVPVTMRERQGGESYLNASHAIAYMARTCLSILLFQWFR